MDGLQLDLDLGPVGGGGGYPVSVRSPAGDEVGEFVFDAKVLLAQRRELQATVLASAVTSRRAVSEVEAPIREAGEALFRALFAGRVYGSYRASKALAEQQGIPLRVVIRTGAPELAALPWEVLYDPDAGVYVCQREPLVRHVAVSSSARPLTIHPPVTILGLVAAPSDLQKLDTAGEKHRLNQALADLGGRVRLRWIPGSRWTDLQQELVAGSWHVLHFIGHGGFDAERGEGILALEGEDGRSDLVGADRFSQLLTTQSPPPQLVVLNSCAGAQAAADDVFSSTAAALVRAGVSAAVAMQFAVSDPAAKAFAAGFYQAIAYNHSVANAVRIGRIGIRGTSQETLEWVTPVLYLRGDDAPLFTVLDSDEPAPSSTEPGPLEAAHAAAAQALYQQAMARLRVGQYAEALPLFDSLLSLEPAYRDAEERRETAAHMSQATEAYESARVAQDREHWSEAIQHYQLALDLDPGHLDSEQRRDWCGLRQKVTDLQRELRLHASAEDWAAAIVVADELSQLDPEAADVDGLAAIAREHVASQREADRDQRGSRWRVAAVAILAAVVGTAGLLLWAPWRPDGTDPPGSTTPVPVPPSGLTGNASGTEIDLRWDPAPPGSPAVAHWEVLRDDAIVDEVTEPQAVDTVPVPGFYSYTIVAVGEDGQQSAKSARWSSPPAWQKPPTGFQEKFSAAGVAAHQGELWVVGGAGEGDHPRDEVRVFDPVQEEWRDGPMLPVAVQHAALVSTGEHLFLLGGLTRPDPGSELSSLDTVYRLDSSEGPWMLDEPLPGPRFAGAAAWDGQRLVFAGGAGWKPRTAAADMWALEDEEWVEIGQLGLAREHLTAVTDGEGTIWFVGGADVGSGQVVNDVDVLHGTDVGPGPAISTAVEGVAAIWTSETGICVFGGSTTLPNAGPGAAPVDAVECLGDSAPQWPTLPEARAGATAAVLGDTVYVVGGYPAPGAQLGAADMVLASRFR